MEFIDTVKKRHAVRNFTNEVPDRKDIKEIVKLAGQNPSWANDQPWKIVVASGDTLKEIKQAYLREMQMGSRPSVELGMPSPADLGSDATKNMNDWITKYHVAQRMMEPTDMYFDAPMVIYLLTPSAHPYATFDVGAFSSTLMLAATDKGYDTMPAGLYVTYSEPLHEILDVGDNYKFALGIGIGHGKKTYINDEFRAEKMPLDEYLTFKD